VFVDTSLRIMRFTPAATQLINLIPGDIGRPVGHVVSNLVSYNALMDDLRGVLETLIPRDVEVQTKDGSWYLMRLRPYRTTENAIEGVVLTFVDISERKRSEEDLRESEARFHSIFNQAFAGVTQTDLEGRFLFVNDRFCEMLGYARDDLVKMRIMDVTHADDMARTAVLMESLALGGSDFSIERRLVRRDQTVVWVSDRVSGIREDNGVTSAVSISFDLSQRKRLEAEAAAADARLADELEALSRLEGVRSLTMTAKNKRTVLEELLNAAIAINRADFGMLHLCDPETDRLTVTTQRGFDNDYVQFWEEEASARGTCAKALESFVGISAEDVTKSPHFVDTPALDVQLRAGVRAVQSVSLVDSSGKPFGVLTTHFRSPHRSDARKQRLFHLVAREAANIIERGMYSDQALDLLGEPSDVG
jgi:PAS domain S-box-containing protein